MTDPAAGPPPIVIHYHYHGGGNNDPSEVLSRLTAIETSLTALKAQGEAIMARIDDLTQNLSDISDLVEQVLGVIQASDAEKAALKQQVADLVAAAGIAQTEKDALMAGIDAAWQKSEDAENKLRAVVPGVPPVGGTPLSPSYADRASFDAAVAAYTGPEAVTVDGGEVKAGTAPSIDYFTHSGDGSVSTSGPTN